MRGRLVDHSEYGQGSWRSRSRFEAKLVSQLHANKPLGHGKHRCIVGDAVLDCLITMSFVVAIEKLMGKDRAPKGVIAQRVEPLLHIINRLKRLHAIKIPNPSRALQI